MMTRREYLQERYEDALFALLMDDLAVEEGKKALQEHKRLKNDPEAEVPDQTLRRGLKTIRKHFSRKNAGKLYRVTAKVISRVAVVALVGTLTFTTAFAASTDFRINTLNYVIDVFDDRAIFSAENMDSDKMPTVSAGWLPEDYAQDDYESADKYVKMLFRTSDGREISVEIYDSSETSVIDTENAELGTAMVNGYEAVTIVKHGMDGYGKPYERSRVIWVDTLRGSYVDIMSNHEDVETLLQVANQLFFE